MGAVCVAASAACFSFVAFSTATAFSFSASALSPFTSASAFSASACAFFSAFALSFSSAFAFFWAFAFAFASILAPFLPIQEGSKGQCCLPQYLHVGVNFAGTKATVFELTSKTGELLASFVQSFGLT